MKEKNVDLPVKQIEHPFYFFHAGVYTVLNKGILFVVKFLLIGPASQAIVFDRVVCERRVM